MVLIMKNLNMNSLNNFELHTKLDCDPERYSKFPPLDLFSNCITYSWDGLAIVTNGYRLSNSTVFKNL